MKEIVITKLKEIELQNNIEILYACESGSRAWGFPSPDSDYDVRFIYKRKIENYLSVFDSDDFLDFPINDILDINGWDIKKVLSLIYKSNTTPFEWLQSPIIYFEKENFRNELWTLCQNYFNEKSNIHHYLGIAKSAFDTLLESDEIKIKKLFYVIRPLFAAKWCVENKKIAPMTIDKLMVLLPDDIKEIVINYLKIKEDANESYLIKLDSNLKDYIKSESDNYFNLAKDYDKIYFNKEQIDEYFRKTIMTQ